MNFSKHSTSISTGNSQVLNDQVSNDDLLCEANALPIWNLSNTTDKVCEEWLLGQFEHLMDHYHSSSPMCFGQIMPTMSFVYDPLNQPTEWHYCISMPPMVIIGTSITELSYPTTFLNKIVNALLGVGVCAENISVFGWNVRIAQNKTNIMNINIFSDSLNANVLHTEQCKINMIAECTREKWEDRFEYNTFLSQFCNWMKTH